LEELQGHGCRVEFLDRPMCHDPHDQLLLQIRGAVAAYERTLSNSGNNTNSQFWRIRLPNETSLLQAALI
jgi:hypothetical protein